MHHGTVCHSETCALRHGEAHADLGTQVQSHLVHLLPIHRYCHFPPARLHIFCARSRPQRAAPAERCAAQSAASPTSGYALAQPRQAVVLIRCVARARIAPAQFGSASSARSVSLPAPQLLAPPRAARPPAIGLQSVSVRTYCEVRPAYAAEFGARAAAKQERGQGTLRTCSCCTSSSAHAAERSRADCRTGYTPRLAGGDTPCRGVDGGTVDGASPQLESPTARLERCGETTEPRRYAV